MCYVIVQHFASTRCFLCVLTAILIWHEGEKMMKEYDLSTEYSS